MFKVWFLVLQVVVLCSSSDDSEYDDQKLATEIQLTLLQQPLVELEDLIDTYSELIETYVEAYFENIDFLCVALVYEEADAIDRIPVVPLNYTVGDNIDAETMEKVGFFAGILFSCINHDLQLDSDEVDHDILALVGATVYDFKQLFDQEFVALKKKLINAIDSIEPECMLEKYEKMDITDQIPTNIFDDYVDYFEGNLEMMKKVVYGLIAFQCSSERKDMIDLFVKASYNRIIFMKATLRDEKLDDFEKTMKCVDYQTIKNNVVDPKKYNIELDLSPEDILYCENFDIGKLLKMAAVEGFDCAEEIATKGVHAFFAFVTLVRSANEQQLEEIYRNYADAIDEVSGKALECAVEIMME